MITRFAPSPTGHLHVGGARTALFNWALAKHSGGRFLLRIEDTDRARSSESAALGILEDLAWLGIAWDDGPTAFGCGGDDRGVGPFLQSQRLARYDDAVDTLLAKDLAYPAFESEEEIAALRRVAIEQGVGFRYSRAPDYARDEALGRMSDHEHVIRFRMPSETVRVHDEVLGEIEFGEEHLDDFIIRKRDGFPTYHFAVVVDDEAMEVTDILRGQEHLNNTPRHRALQRALGYREPAVYHLPLIFNLDGSKMSKRDKDKAARKTIRERLKRDGELRGRLEAVVGAKGFERWLGDKRAQLEGEALAALAEELHLELPMIDVEDFRRAGFLPEVLVNYLALLGWNPGRKDEEGKDLERFDQAFLATAFDPARIGRANAKFDPQKLEAFNAETLAQATDEAFLAHLKAWCERYDAEALQVLGDRAPAFVAAMKGRSKTLADALRRDGPGRFALFADDAFDYDVAAVTKVLRKGDPNGFARLREVRAILADLASFDAEAVESVVAAFCESAGLGLGKVAQPLRVAVSGRAASPPLGATLAILGRESTLARIDRCLALEEA